MSPVVRPLLIASIALMASMLLPACGGCGEHASSDGGSRPARSPTKRPPPSRAATATAAFAPTGTVVGTVRVHGDVPVSRDLASRLETRVPRPAGCRPITDEERRPVHVGTDGRTGDVLITATFPRTVRLPPEARKNRPIVIRDCRMTPRLLAATRGDTLVIRNEDEYPFVPRVNPIAMGFMQALMQGQSRRVDLERGGVFEADCGFGAPCGVTTVVVLYHPVHATSAADGTFRVEGVPADVDVEMHAWHPALRDQTRNVRVTRGGSATVEFTLEPNPEPPRPAEPEPDAGTGHPEDQPGTVF